MAKTLNSKMKLCKVIHNGPIMALGGVTGPILYPCRIDLRKVINMVHQGIRVVEVNPKNHKETIELTIQNVSLNNFPETPKYKMPEVIKKEEPVVAKEKDVIPATQNNIVSNVLLVNENNSTLQDILYPEESRRKVLETTHDKLLKRNSVFFKCIHH